MKQLLRLFISRTILISFLLSIYSFDGIDDIKKIVSEPVTIKGKLQNYNSKFKTGMISYFDAITRTTKTEVFAFDSIGNFEVTFKLTHEVYDCVSLKYGSDFFNLYVQPRNTYKVTIIDNTLYFDDSENPIGNELIKFEDALNKELGSEIKSANSAHNLNLSINDYLAIQKNIETKKLAFLNSYNTCHKLSDDALRILNNKIKYKTAKAWINYRYDNSGKSLLLRDSLPKDFYTMLFNEYPINSNDGFIVREYIDYLNNIGNSMNNSAKAPIEERIKFYNTFNYFTQDELQLISKAYSGDSITLNSTELKEFNNDKNKRMHEYEFRKRFQMNSIYNNSIKLPKGFGRDLILSQQIAELYITNSFSPTVSEWVSFETFFSNKSVIDYLKSICTENPQIETKNQPIISKETDNFTQGVVNKYLKRHTGKVIYIDFWATWCSPCKNEIPFAKKLHIELKDEKDVVFINFCVLSDKIAWNKLIEEQHISGINYLLDNDEFNVLTKHFQVNGYPTYILIDKNGNIVDYTAPRPSSNEIIMNRIKKLLQ